MVLANLNNRGSGAWIDAALFPMSDRLVAAGLTVTAWNMSAALFLPVES
jgi:hypothetical protein